MTVSIVKEHNATYFKSMSRFYPMSVSESRLKPSKPSIPKKVDEYLTNTVQSILTLIQSGEDRSCPRYLRVPASPVVLYDDDEVTAAANASTFIELSIFYDDQPHLKLDQMFKETSKHLDDWYVISASSQEGVPILVNFTIQGKALEGLILLLSSYRTPPVQELLAYRTGTLYNSLILACSKPF